MLTSHAPESKMIQSRSLGLYCRSMCGSLIGLEAAAAMNPRLRGPHFHQAMYHHLPPPADSPGPPTPASDPSEDEIDDEELMAGDVEEIHTLPDKIALVVAASLAFLPGEDGQDVAPPIVPHYYRCHLLCPVYHVPL